MSESASGGDIVSSAGDEIGDLTEGAGPSTSTSTSTSGDVEDPPVTASGDETM